jgi:hypothetical protein
VKHISLDMFMSTTVLRTAGGVAVAWQPPVGWMGLSIGATQVLCMEGTTRIESVQRDKSVK